MQHLGHDPTPEVAGNTVEVCKIAGYRKFAGFARIVTGSDRKIDRYLSSEVLEVVVGSRHILAGIVRKAAGEVLGPGRQAEAGREVDDIVPAPGTSHKIGFLGNQKDSVEGGMARVIHYLVVGQTVIDWRSCPLHSV